jgi:GNAT superfamily N-acetyltransferase
MSRRLTGLTLDTVDDLVGDCRACVFWELDPAAEAAGLSPAAAAVEKEGWLSETLREWGSCGQILYQDGVPVGHALYAPPAYVPRSGAFATAPVSPDAVLLMTVRVRPDRLGTGLGRVLIQGVARDLVRRGIRAVEAFGTRPGLPFAPDARCLIPTDYLLSVGFRTVRPHPTSPRLRMDLRSTVTWRAEVETALERLWGTVHAPAPRPGAALSARRP